MAKLIFEIKQAGHHSIILFWFFTLSLSLFLFYYHSYDLKFSFFLSLSSIAFSIARNPCNNIISGFFLSLQSVNVLSTKKRRWVVTTFINCSNRASKQASKRTIAGSANKTRQDLALKINTSNINICQWRGGSIR